MASFAGSDNGFTIKKGCKLFIFLNGRKPKNRILFTVAYELGHIESGHLDKINCLGLTMNAHYNNNSQSVFFENEANSLYYTSRFSPVEGFFFIISITYRQEGSFYFDACCICFQKALWRMWTHQE